MGLKEDISEGVNGYFNGTYEVVDGRAIPVAEDIPLGKHGREIEMAMLFIDIRESTKIVDGTRRATAAKMYKSFLFGVSKIARNNGGKLLSFNGDGILVGFIGDNKRTMATKTALQLSSFVKNVLKPKMDACFANNQSLKDMEFDFGIGIDAGKVLVVRGGIQGQGNNDLVWVGNATNFAVKLSDFSKDGYHVYITEDVYKNMSESSKLGGPQKKNMWEARDWNGSTIYRSNWTWSL